MIQAKAELQDGRILILLGLSAENIRRLQQNEVIRVDPEVLLSVKPGETIGAITIFAGESEASMAKMLQDQGFISDETIVRALPRGPKGSQ